MTDSVNLLLTNGEKGRSRVRSKEEKITLAIWEAEIRRIEV
jgi:hypothetical protein